MRIVKLCLALLLITLIGCGYTSKNNTLIGQVKRVHHETPIIGPDHDVADVSLGILQDGNGSVSKQDIELYVPNPDDLKILEHAVNTGEIVRIEYNSVRLTFFVPKPIVTKVEIVKRK